MPLKALVDLIELPEILGHRSLFLRRKSQQRRSENCDVSLK
jgi:hypothetical protein